MWNTRLSELEFDGDELAGALGALESNWITAGPRTEEFERTFARVAGTTEAVAVSNGTAALILALKTLGIGPGDEVLCPSMTFVATAAAILHCGATPIFVDIVSLEDPTIDPEDAALKVTARTRAILPVHYAGIPCDMDRLSEIARGHDLAIIEDAAHAPGATYRGRPCGSLGSAGCFSLFGNKNITTGEGGVVTTDDREFAERLRLGRSHGMTKTTRDRDCGRSAHYDVVEIGFNFRFDDIRAAIGLAQLAKLTDINRRRATIVERYNYRLAIETDLILPFRSVAADRVPAFHVYPVVLPSRADRDTMESELRERGIQTSIHYRPVHQLTAIRSLYPDVSLPITESYGERELTLPLYASLHKNDVDSITEAVARSLASGPPSLLAT